MWFLQNYAKDLHLKSIPYKIRINYFIVLRNRTQLSKIEDLFFSIQQFMNQAAPHPASRTRPQGTVQSGRFLYAERGWN